MTYLSSNQLKQYEDEGYVSSINIFCKGLIKKELTNLMKKLIFLSLFLFSKTLAFENVKIDFRNFSLNKYEITIQEFKNYAKKII